jgi:hypothetical protein
MPDQPRSTIPLSTEPPLRTLWHYARRHRGRGRGTHDELVAHGGLYAARWRVQTGEADSLPAA